MIRKWSTEQATKNGQHVCQTCGREIKRGETVFQTEGISRQVPALQECQRCACGNADFQAKAFTAWDIARQVSRQLDVYTLPMMTWGEFLQTGENAEKPKSSRDVERGRSPWSGVETWEKGVELAATGWAEGREQIIAIRDAIHEQIDSLLEVPVLGFDVCDGELEIGRFVEGEPECWMIEEMEEGTPRKTVKIEAEMSVSSKVKPEQYIQRGAAVAALVELIEMAGLRVELVGSHRSQNGVSWAGPDKAVFEFSFGIKAADQNLEIDRLAFALAQPATFRRFGFAIYEAMPEHLRIASGIYSAYGRPVGGSVLGDADVLVDHNDIDRNKNFDDSVAWVKEHLARLGLIRPKEESEAA